MKCSLTMLAFGIILVSNAFAGGTLDWPPAPVPEGANPASIPTPRLEWFERFQRHLDESKAMPTIDLIFDGDTLTDGWMTRAKDIWDTHYTKLNAFNFGTYEDKTQNLLWRLENGQVDNLHPKLIILMIGAYGLGGDAPKLAEGIKAVVDEYRKRCPDAVILLQGLLPRGTPIDPARDEIKQINQIISAYADNKNVFFIDFGGKFLRPDGSIDSDLMPDLSHPSAKGYQLWADAIQPFIDKYVAAVAPKSGANTAPALPARAPAPANKTITWPPPAITADANPAAIPTGRLEWFQKFQQNLDAAKAMPSIDIVFDGDTLIDGWQSTGKEIWTHHYAGLNAFDFGLSEDRTQNMLWRIENGELDNLHPKLVVLMIGTLNAGQPEQAGEAIKTILSEYQKRCPGAVIVLQAITPRGTDATREKITATNQIISGLADGKKVIYLDFGEKLLMPDGKTNPDLMGSFFLTANGYQVWADALQPLIDKYVPATASTK